MSLPIQLQLRDVAASQSMSVQSYLNIIATGRGTDVVAIGFTVDRGEVIQMLSQVTLNHLSALRSMMFAVRFDLGDQEAVHVELWRNIGNIILSLPDPVTLDFIIIDGAFQKRLLGRGWAQSPIVMALRGPLNSLGCRLAALIDRGRAPAITLWPRPPATAYDEQEKKRIASLLGPLGDYSMLRS